MVFVSYAEYLTTASWQVRSWQAKDRAGWRCEGCHRSDRPLETHHLTYARVGREREDDLVVLCDECHDLAHHHPDSLQLPLPFTAERIQ